MLNELRKNSRKKMIVLVIFWLSIAMIVMCYAWFSGLCNVAEKPIDLNKLTVEQLKEGYVEGDIHAILDYYMYTTDEGETVQKQYFIPVGEEAYIGLVANREYMPMCDEIMKECQEYLEGTRSSLDNTVHVKGTILKMDSESLGFYKSYYKELGIADDGEDIFMPYYLKIDYIGKYHKSFYYLLGVVAAFCMIAAIWVFIKNVTGLNQKMITAYCSKAPDYDHAMRQLNEFYYSTVPVQGIRVSPEFFMAPKGMSTLFLKTDDILWVYQSSTTHRTNGIKTGTTYALVIRLKNGKQYQLTLKNEAAVQETLRYIENTVSHWFIGYDEQLERIYNKNRQEMLDESNRRKTKMPAYTIPGQEEGNIW